MPLTVGVQVEVWLVKMDAGEQLTATAVIVGETGGVLPPPVLPPPPQPAIAAKTAVAAKRVANANPKRNEPRSP